MNAVRPRANEQHGTFAVPCNLVDSPSLAMGILMQVFGRSFAALQQNAVFRQQQLAVAGQTCEAQNRLNVFGVGPVVLTEAANRLAAAHLKATAPPLLALLQVADSEPGLGLVPSNRRRLGQNTPE